MSSPLMMSPGVVKLVQAAARRSARRARAFTIQHPFVAAQSQNNTVVNDEEPTSSSPSSSSSMSMSMSWATKDSIVSSSSTSAPSSILAYSPPVMINQPYVHYRGGDGQQAAPSTPTISQGPALHGEVTQHKLAYDFVPDGERAPADRQAWQRYQDNRMEHAQACLVFLHGLGDEGKHWEDFVRASLAVAAETATEDKRAWPQRVAVSLPTTTQVVRWSDAHLTAWMLPSPFRADAKATSTSARTRADDGQCLARSVRQVHEIIRDVIRRRNTDASRVILGGFSQGAAMALLAAATFESKLGGAISLSGYLPTWRLPDSLKRAMDQPLDMQVLMCHGDHDGVIAVESAQIAREELERRGATVESHTFPWLDHAPNEEEIAIIGRWLTQRWATKEKNL